MGLLNGKSNLNGAKSLTNRCEPDVAATETPKMDLPVDQLQRLHDLDVHVCNQRRNSTCRPLFHQARLKQCFITSTA